MYFSWTDIDEIHGDLFRKEKAEINFKQDFISPKAIIDEIETTKNTPTIKNVRVIEILDSPFYEFSVDSKDKNFVVANAISGKIRSAITEKEAKKIATESLVKPLKIQEIVYLTKKNVGGHHEYREKPLPAWAVTYENDLTIYLSAENGQIGAFRTTKWRIFDFLWMLHTMDFFGRDNINNYLLRAFSILGIVTILSGFALFFVSSKFIRKILLKKKIN